MLFAGAFHPPAAARGREIRRVIYDWKVGIGCGSVAALVDGPAAYQALLGAGAADVNATFFDFVQQPYPHQGPVDFGAVRLDRATAPAEAAPGERIKVTVSWAELSKPLTATLRLVSPAVPRHNVPYTLAESGGRILPEQELELALPPDLARGLYLLELHVHSADGELYGQTEQGRGMGTLYVGTLRVPQGPRLQAEPPVVAELGNGDLTLHAVTAEQPTPTELRLKMAWSTVGTARNWSLSLRLQDANGRQLVQQDLQPGYGYLPTSLWAADRAGDRLSRAHFAGGIGPGRVSPPGDRLSGSYAGQRR